MQDQALHIAGIELIGPIAETPRGNKYLVVALDYLTKRGEVAAIPDKKSGTVAQLFERDVTAGHGCPGGGTVRHWHANKTFTNFL